jgi:hypothetical protein
MTPDGTQQFFEDLDLSIEDVRHIKRLGIMVTYKLSDNRF